MTILYMQRSEANGSVLLQCSGCGCDLDRLRQSEFQDYYKYLLRTADYPYCDKCDPVAGDMVHPFIEEYSQQFIGFENTTFMDRLLSDLRLSCLLPNQKRDEK